jgi:hypothetical protein
MRRIVPAIHRAARRVPGVGVTDEFDQLLKTMRKAAAVLRESEIPFALAGGLAVWARGGPKTEHDVDFLVKPDDADRALEVLVGAGMRGERPAEGWLLKAWDDGQMIDLIFDPAGGPIDDDWLDRAELIEVYATTMPVASLEDVLVTRLMALNEQYLDYSGVLEMARAVREQIDWEQVRARTEDSPYAVAFFTLTERLEVIEPSG